MRLPLILFQLCLSLDWAEGWFTLQSPHQSPIASSTCLDPTRRTLFIVSTGIVSVGITPFLNSPVHATVSRAVGSGEQQCRVEGNCLEVGELDGALGWEWGGKNRCDPADPMCGADGTIRTEPLVGKEPPAVPILTESGESLRFSHVVAIQIEIGRGEVGVLKFGMYGYQAPASVSQLVDFLSSDGLRTASSVPKQTIGKVQPAVSLTQGGVVTSIVPGKVIELGVPSQAISYAKSRGRNKAGDDFLPQPRPPPAIVVGDDIVRRHDSAGLVSVPLDGLGNGGTGFEPDDEAFASAFLITNAPLLDLDQKRRVVGQILDATSMAFLERLVNIATKRGIRGVLPGQTSGPPLPRVVVREIQVAKASTS